MKPILIFIIENFNWWTDPLVDFLEKNLKKECCVIQSTQPRDFIEDMGVELDCINESRTVYFTKMSKEDILIWIDNLPKWDDLYKLKFKIIS